EMERLGHLLGGLVAGPGVGEAQRRRDAVGGEEKVAVLLAQPGVQFEGELVVPLDHRRLVRRGRRSRIGRGAGGESKGQEQGEYYAFHGVILLRARSPREIPHPNCARKMPFAGDSSLVLAISVL